MIILSYLFVVGSFLFAIYSLYLCVARYLKIKNLPSTIIKDTEKTNYLIILKRYVLIIGGCNIFSIYTLFLKSLEFRLVFSVTIVIIASYIVQTLLDEIEDFDISKKDADIILEFINNRTKDAKEKAKTNKIKKVDSIGNLPEESEQTKEEKQNEEEESKDNEK